MTPQAAVAKYPNFLKLGEDGVLEIYLDNAMLSVYRKCPGYFIERYLNKAVLKGKSWSLEFGSYFHKMMEYFYKGQRDNWEGWWHIEKPFGLNNSGELDLNIKQDYANFIQLGIDLWSEFKLEEFSDYKQYKSFGGVDGAILLFSQYFKTHYNQERYRYVGWELSFGKDKEVPIGQLYNWEPLDTCQDAPYQNVVVARFYYCGRIDLVIDDGDIIGPLDHKTTARFDGSENSDFKPHDGMQGYVFAMQKMMADKIISVRACNSIIVNHVALTYPAKDPMQYRFKKSKKSYTSAEMSEWLGRQQTAFKNIYEFLILEQPAYWNTDACAYWIFGSPCVYKPLHEVTPASRDSVRNQFYNISPDWKTL